MTTKTTLWLDADFLQSVWGESDAAGDAAWSALQVWQDLNGDGVTQEGELVTVAAANDNGFYQAKVA